MAAQEKLERGHASKAALVVATVLLIVALVLLAVLGTANLGSADTISDQAAQQAQTTQQASEDEPHAGSCCG